ncbi:hypothetical protein R1sor_027414 [Riccia sorocarpa]|uniref:Endonuclease/exonuclease/phosphatase domain-containing protein n=1 Tax=Riccia sorocarpa TaxID=122646 RepID=A0ABD3GFM4_9MARC
MKAVSWNVFGLGKHSRLQKVQNWIRDQGVVDVLMIQELRIREQLAERRLTELCEGSNYAIDYTTEGKAGAAVAILNKKWKVTEKGVKGDGHAAWIICETEIGQLGLVSVHGPREKGRRKQDDKLIKAKHDTRRRLSDHKPVSLSFEKREGQRSRKTTYYKVSPEILKYEQTIEEVSRMWKEAGKSEADPRRSWDLKWAEAKRVLMKKSVVEREKLDLLRKYLEELNTQKVRVAMEHANTPCIKLTELEEKIRGLEKEQEKLWKRWSRIRWISEGDMPSKFFFAILKAKRAKESITSLKTEDERLIEKKKKEEILKELTRYYTNLFKQDPITERDR